MSNTCSPARSVFGLKGEANEDKEVKILLQHPLVSMQSRIPRSTMWCTWAESPRGEYREWFQAKWEGLETGISAVECRIADLFASTPLLNFLPPYLLPQTHDKYLYPSPPCALPGLLFRRSFMFFIGELRERCEIWRLEGREDDRIKNEGADRRADVFFASEEGSRKSLVDVTGGAGMKEITITLMSRQLRVWAITRQNRKLVVSSTFADLCQNFLGSTDYHALCKAASTIYLTGGLTKDPRRRLAVKGEGRNSPSMMSTLIGGMEWSATGLAKAPLASVGAGETDVRFAIGRAISRPYEMGSKSCDVRDWLVSSQVLQGNFDVSWCVTVGAVLAAGATHLIIQ